MANVSATGYHEQATIASTKQWPTTGSWQLDFTYTFRNFFHPFVGELISRLNQGDLADVMDASWQDSLQQDFFQHLYNPNPDPSNLVNVDYFPKQIDVE